MNKFECIAASLVYFTASCTSHQGKKKRPGHAFWQHTAASCASWITHIQSEPETNRVIPNGYKEVIESQYIWLLYILMEGRCFCDRKKKPGIVLYTVFQIV